MHLQGHRSGPSVNQSANVGRHRHVLNTKQNNSKAPKSSSLHLPVCLSQEIKILTNSKYLLNTFKVNEAEKKETADRENTWRLPEKQMNKASPA